MTCIAQPILAQLEGAKTSGSCTHLGGVLQFECTISRYHLLMFSEEMKN